MESSSVEENDLNMQSKISVDAESLYVSTKVDVVNDTRHTSSMSQSTQICKGNPFGKFKVRKKVNLNKSDDSVNIDTSVSPLSNRVPLVSLDMNQDVLKDKILYQSPNSVKTAVQKSIQNPHLIGDFSQTFHLPVTNGTHVDLPCVTPQTVAMVLKEKQTNCLFFDCRYPYEYDGGHIETAENVYSQDDILKRLFNSDTMSKQSSVTILIFYCEFSSKRAPTMIRFVRNYDRNVNSYPNLYYPEIYLLEGGYKAFFQDFKEYCVPPLYKTMLDKDCTKQLTLYKQKCSTKKTCRRSSSRRLPLKF